MNLIIEKLLEYADTYGSLIPLSIILLLFSKRKMPLGVKLLAAYFILSFLLFGLSNYLADRSINNLFIYHIFAILEFVFIGQFFRTIISSKKFKSSSLYIIIIFCLLALINSILFEKFTTLNSNVIAIEFLLLIIFSFIYYFELSYSEEVLVFYRQPNFWIITGFFVYFASCILIFALYKYTAVTNRQFVLKFWLIQVVMYIVKNIILAKGILCYRYNK